MDQGNPLGWQRLDERRVLDHSPGPRGGTILEPNPITTWSAARAFFAGGCSGGAIRELDRASGRSLDAEERGVSPLMGGPKVRSYQCGALWRQPWRRAPTPTPSWARAPGRSCGGVHLPAPGHQLHERSGGSDCDDPNDLETKRMNPMGIFAHSSLEGGTVRCLRLCTSWIKASREIIHQGLEASAPAPPSAQGSGCCPCGPARSTGWAMCGTTRSSRRWWPPACKPRSTPWSAPRWWVAASRTSTTTPPGRRVGAAAPSSTRRAKAWPPRQRHRPEECRAPLAFVSAIGPGSAHQPPECRPPSGLVSGLGARTDHEPAQCPPPTWFMSGSMAPDVHEWPGCRALWVLVSAVGPSAAHEAHGCRALPGFVVIPGPAGRREARPCLCISVLVQ